MQTLRNLIARVLGVLVAMAVVQPAMAVAQQLPLYPDREAGLTVTPAFEGWYKNPDGTFSIAFGYLNRNTREVLEIPVGRGNFITPGDSNQGQPTRFEVRRHWGVFAVKVPADFGDKSVSWNISFRGETYAIPGSLKRGWEIDAIEGEGAAGNRPPMIKFGADGPSAHGPGGGYGTPLTAVVGKPLELVVWALDVPSRTVSAAPAAAGRAAGAGRAATAGRGAGRGVAVPTLAWFKHQGPGDVTFTPSAPRADAANEGRATATATFSAPGDYILRLRASEGSVASAGHAQCCWTNGFVKVTVSR